MELIDWLLTCGEPWTRYRTPVDLPEVACDDPHVQATRSVMLSHPRVRALIEGAASWPGCPI